MQGMQRQRHADGFGVESIDPNRLGLVADCALPAFEQVLPRTIPHTLRVGAVLSLNAWLSTLSFDGACADEASALAVYVMSAYCSGGCLLQTCFAAAMQLF